jgi:hypothetical protein
VICDCCIIVIVLNNILSLPHSFPFSKVSPVHSTIQNGIEDEMNTKEKRKQFSRN